MNIDMSVLPELVKAGFLGFAVAIMLLSYSLLKEVVKNNENVPKAVTESRSKLVLFFLSLSAGVLVLGIVFAFFSAPRQMDIKIAMTPNRHDIVGSIAIIGPDGVQKWYNPGEPNFVVSSNAPLLIDLNNIREKLDELYDTVAMLRNNSEGASATAKELINKNVSSPLENVEESI